MAITLPNGLLELLGIVQGTAILGTNGNDAFNGTAANEHYQGLGGNDAINSGAGQDFIDAGAGNDAINAGDGNDYVEGGTGNDAMNGGGGPNGGNDTLGYSQSTVGVTIGLNNSGSGTASSSANGHDSFSNFENVVGSNFNDTITGNNAANILAGLAGNDILNGGNGNDILVGGAGADAHNGGNGTDTANYSTSAAPVSVVLGGVSTGGDAAGDTFSSIESFVGTAGADVFDGSTSLTGFSVDGGGGGDSMFGGHGNDHLSIGGTAALALAGFAALAEEGGVLVGGEGNDDLDGGDDNDTLDGGDGDDDLDGGAGDDILTDGPGNDIASGGDGDDDFNVGPGFNDLSGGDGSDDFEFDASVIPPDAGSNSLLVPPPPVPLGNYRGGFGPDYLSYRNMQFGGHWDGIMRGPSSFNLEWRRRPFVASDANESQQIASDADDAQQVSAEFFDIENIILTNYDDLFVLSGNDDVERRLVVSGEGGNDEINVGTGSDTINGGEGNDVLTGGDGNHTINGDNGDDTLDGGDGNDTINGGDGNDTLNGGAGDDLLIGGPGADAIDGGDGIDTIDYSASPEGVQVLLLPGVPSTVNGGDAEGDTITNVENVNGSDFADQLIGYDGPNVFYGAGGIDTYGDIVANTGDTFLFKSFSDALTNAGGETINSAFATLDFSAIDPDLNPDNGDQAFTMGENLFVQISGGVATVTAIGLDGGISMTVRVDGVTSESQVPIIL